MPAGALRECRMPRCPGYADSSGYCSQHNRHDHFGPSPSERGQVNNTNRTFRRMRLAFLRLHPMCAACGLAPADTLDHITPHRGNQRLFWSQDNWQPMCARCHNAKSRLERFQ